MTCDVTRFRKESDRRQSSQSTIRTRSVTLPLLLTGKKAFLTTVPSQKMLKVCISLSMVALARGFTANPASLSPAGAQRCMCRSADPEMFIG